MEFGNLIEYELMTNRWMFEDVKAFKRVDKKYEECFIKDRKNFIENEASLLELALDVSNLYEHNTLYPSCFGSRYKRVKGDNKYRFNENETGVYMTDVHYP